MAYEGGYTSAVNSASQRAQQEAQTAALIQAFQQQKMVFDQQQQAQQRRAQSRAQLGAMLPELLQMQRPPEDAFPTPQPPMPGAASQPMMPPGGGGPPPPMGQIPPPPGPGFATPGGQQPMGQMAPPPGPGFASPPPGVGPIGTTPAGPPPGAPQVQQMPGQRGAGGAPQPLGQQQGWQPLPKPPAGMGGAGAAPGGIPPPPENAVMPRQMVSVSELAKLLKSKGIEGAQALDMIDEWKPYMDSQNKQELASMKVQLEASNAATKAYKAVVDAARDKEKLGQGQQRIDQKAPLVRAQTAKLTRAPGGGAGGGNPSGLSEGAIQTAAEQYNATGVMPSFGRGNGPARTAIMNRAAELRPEGGDIVGDRADAKAAQGALNALTKDIASIRPYKVMLDKNGDIAIDLAKKAIATDSKLANKPLNWVRQNMGDNPDVAEFLAQAQIVSTEAARVLNNPRLVGQLTDSARHEMESIINGDMPLNSFTRVVERMKKDGENRTAAMEDEAKELRAKIGGKKPSVAPTAKSGAPASTNAKGWKLMTDKAGNKAYVSPDGKQFEEVQ